MARNIDFMGRRMAAVGLSIAMVIGSLVVISVKGIEKNVDFEGGSKLTVAFVSGDLAVGDLRDKVGAVESGATIVALETEEAGSEFSIKIKNPQSDQDSSDISPERRRGLEAAFASVAGEAGTTIELLKKVSVEELAARLTAENIYGISDTDQVREAAYRQLADRIKAGLDGAADLRTLTQTVDAEKAGTLLSGLTICYPAINRTTPDQFNAVLKKYNPLGRDAAVGYRDITDQVMKARAAKKDFFASFDFIDGIAVGADEDAAALGTFLRDNFTLGTYRIVAIENFSASIAAELLSNAYTAVILALFFILLYLWMRFSLGYGVASVIALAHDVIIAMGVFSLVGAELSNPVVAAFLTVVGYSLNDTIVVFDRIRENLHKKSSGDLLTVMNSSINQTLSRTVVTSLTTLFVVIVINLFSGNETLETFSFPLLVGIVVGTYSSIFVASPVLSMWNDKVKPVNS